MTHLTPVTAKDEAYRLFTDGFNAHNEFDAELRYQGVANNNEPGPLWVRVSMQQVQSPLSAFVCSDDGADNQLFETSGLFFAMVQVAISEEDAMRKGDLIATACRDILRSANTPSGMWFRNARFTELPSDGQFYIWRVVAEYEFDEQTT